jgi:hypothetical protein
MPRLLHRAQDASLTGAADAPSADPALATVASDLGLDDVVAAMAAGDELIADVARRVLLTSLLDRDDLTYRQGALGDALAHRQLVRDLYDLAGEALDRERGVYGGLVTNPTSVLQRAVEVLEATLDVLRRLRVVAEANVGVVSSEAFRSLLSRLRDVLDDAFLAEAASQLQRLRFRDGVTVGVRLGVGGKGVGHVLREPPLRQPVLRRLLAGSRTPATIRVDEQDDASARALQELREQAITPVADVLARASRDVLTSLGALRRELGFYVGCGNLTDRLGQLGAPTCVPEVRPAGEPVLTAAGLYDIGLSLRTGKPVVGNDVAADGRPLVLVTGANQGGKSTFLRSVGLAQLMAQAGMFVAADAFRTSVASHWFTHFERGEDATMVSGRLDAELAEMSAIVDRLRPGDLLLLNESFGSTNEREGSLLARDIVRALTSVGVRVVYVTHLYDLAAALYRDDPAGTCFLRAERRPDGTRTYRVLEGAPLPTSYGQDLYDQVFGTGTSGGGRSGATSLDPTDR